MVPIAPGSRQGCIYWGFLVVVAGSFAVLVRAEGGELSSALLLS